MEGRPLDQVAVREARKAPLVLRCKKCGRRLRYSRSLDPSIPTSVAEIVTSFCDRRKCDEPGGFMTEDWLDANGLHVDPDETVSEPEEKNT